MNPMELAQEIEARYQRYLKTTFYFRDKELRDSFEDALESGHLSKGPYLEATLVYKRDQTPRALFPGLLGFQPDEGFLKALQDDRPLYAHQEQAIRQVSQGHNVVIATGTGSGKTEAFLYPILLHLYQEFRLARLGPGVRALILYPMNALANDQRDRLGEISKRLRDENSPFRFTFGQYIGETPEDENDSRRRAKDLVAERERKGFRQTVDGRVANGELVLRSEMRNAPPHILLTNYSMLEYLLLRPDDSPLFDNGQARWWTFLVLDEAHQYRGSRGIEMAMLLRRLKQRLREGGRSEPFRCIATSATLAEGDKDRAAIAEFASRLFGEDVLEGNVILGDPAPIPESGSESLLPGDYQLLAETLKARGQGTEDRIGRLANKLGILLPSSEKPPTIMGALLQHDGRATRLRRLITANPTDVVKVADHIFGDLSLEKRASALSELVELLLQARDPVSGAPLLSARYHLLLRSLEGAFVSYWPERRVFLDRQGGDGKYTVFEVALCRECGQDYFVGPKDFTRGNLAKTEAIRDPSHSDFGATFFRPLGENEEEGEEDESSETRTEEVFQLCIRCGEMDRGKPRCGHDNVMRVKRQKSQEDEDRADQMVKCGACGYSAAGRDPVREVIHGADGPHAVIATTLYQRLPVERKKVLAFADGRQDAAFFAWYLEDSYRDILNRNLILKAAQVIHEPHAQEGLSLSSVAARLLHQYRDAFQEKPSDDSSRIRANIWRALYREYLTDERRISLEGVGLVHWSVEWPDWFTIPSIFGEPPWSLSEQESWDLMLVLLDSMRTDRAVELRSERGVFLSWDDLDLQASQMRFRIGRPARPKGAKSWPVRSWDGVDQWNHVRDTKRTALLKKLLGDSLGEKEALDRAVEVLRDIWQAFRCEDSVPSDDRLLIPVDDARRLNPDWWRLHLITSDDEIFQCTTCGRLQTVSIRDFCPRQGCRGKLVRKRPKDLETNHYRLLYEEELPGSLRVEEHTAQLDHEKAREFQRDFKEGRIHVLSCSTTFELGVDLGDLDTIFLRNVPPEAFNYAQRVGRAGRRERPGFAITYCRRSPHDLYHFAEPERMLSGKVWPPVLSLRNERIITRHIAATALSWFFRAFPERFKRREDRASRVDRLFVDLANPSAVADFVAFLHGRRAALEESLASIVPPDPQVVAQVGLDNGTWIDKIAGSNSRFSLAEAEISSDYRNVRKIEDDASSRKDHKKAGWAQRRADTIATDEVLSFLSRKTVIPKYGFPVDVVELDTQRAQHGQESMEVSLQRDLTIAVSEFAPTSKLIANKKVWTSYGLKTVVGKAWERWWYGRCSRDNYFIRGSAEEEVVSQRCCPDMTVAEYIDPQFGFVTSWEKPAERPRARPARAFVTRPYFAGFRDQLGAPIRCGDVSLTPVSPGSMVVLCEGRRGRGFYVCEQCGAGFRQREKTHKTPYGQDCRGRLDRVSLGHEFVTDVLRLQFHPRFEGGMEPTWFAYSLAYALVEGAAEVLEIPSADLSAAVAFGIEEYIPPIILYDNVPGGAGLVARLEKREVLRACLGAALKRVDGKCGCDKSCYGCLRNYRNQFAHQDLQREPVMGYLETLLSQGQ